MSMEQLVVMGDFNLHMDVPTDNYAIAMSDLPESLSLQQHMEGPTFIQGNTLDLVITLQSDQIICKMPCSNWYFSDHASVLWSLGISKQSLSIKTVFYRKLKSVDVIILDADLANSDLCRKAPRRFGWACDVITLYSEDYYRQACSYAKQNYGCATTSSLV